MMHSSKEGSQSRNNWPKVPSAPIDLPASASPIVSQNLSSEAGIGVEADLPLDRHPKPDLSDSKISNPNSLAAIIEKSRSRATANLLVENLIVTASSATLCYLTSIGLKDSVEGILAQPPVIKLGSVLPLTAVFTFSAISVVMWSMTGVALVERGWKSLLKKLNLEEG